MFFKVSFALFILTVSTMIFANCVLGKVDLLIFHLQNSQSGYKQFDTDAHMHHSHRFDIVNSQRSGRTPQVFSVSRSGRPCLKYSQYFFSKVFIFFSKPVKSLQY